MRIDRVKLIAEMARKDLTTLDFLRPVPGYYYRDKERKELL